MVRSPDPFGLGRNGCWPSLGSQLPWALPFIFSLCCLLNDSRRAAHSFYKIDRLFSLFFSPALLRLLILLLLLMSSNVHPNPGPIFPCSVCAGNVTWRGKSVQCGACSKWVHLRCSQLSLSKFTALTLGAATLPNHYDSLLGFLRHEYPTVQSGPASANIALSPHPCLQTSYPPSAHHITSLSAPHNRPLLLPLSGFFNGMLEVFEPGVLNYSTFFCPILSTSSAFRNPILTHLPLSGFSALRSDRTHTWSGIISSDTMHASGGVVIFVRQGLSFSELSTSSLSSLDPYSDYVGINISLNKSSLLSFLRVYTPLFAPTQRMAE